MILYNVQDVEMPVIPKKTISNWIKQVIFKYQKRVGDVSYIFCSDKIILEINKQFLAHDYFTDVITFDYSKGNKICGDIFISLETVRTNAEKYKVSFENELFRVMIHGILHLCGMDDKGKEARELMEQSENEALIFLKL